MEKRGCGRKSGFTLIELLVVIMIIAILAAILFPVFVAAKQRGQQANCLGNLKQLAAAMETYIAQYGEAGHYNTGDAWWPFVERNAPPLFSPGAGEGESGFVAGDARRLWISRFLKTPGVAKCPGNKGAVDVYAHINGAPPIQHKRLTFAWDYTANIGYTDPSKARRPSRVIAWVEENTDSSVVHKESKQGYGNIINDVVFADSDITSYRHSGMANVAFGDGHAGSVRGGLSGRDATWSDGTPMFYEP